MIVNALLQVLYTLLDAIMIFDIPDLPPQISNGISYALTYITQGVGVLTSFIGPDAMAVLGVLFGLFVVLNVAFFAYSVAWWFIRKLPFLQIRE